MKVEKIDVSNSFLQTLSSREKVSGYTHPYYSYPARFSPQFVKSVIMEFSNYGDVILDPFVGGGTTLVEAMALGRKSIGVDVNTLACFVSTVKTTLLTDEEIKEIQQWLNNVLPNLNLHKVVDTELGEWELDGYLTNLPWRLRKFFNLVLAHLPSLGNERQRDLIRCVLLKIGSWALGKKGTIPPAKQIRRYFSKKALEFLEANKTLAEMAVGIDNNSPEVIEGSIVDFDVALKEKLRGEKPSLIITSPPYPGVHILYHRWQVHGRKESPAPYWLINRLDGKSGSYYTLGSRTETGEDEYFQSIHKGFSNITEIIKSNSLVVQLIGFSNVQRQLPKYLRVMENAGLRRLDIGSVKGTTPYLTREVPSRKWYAELSENESASQEYLLIHKSG